MAYREKTAWLALAAMLAAFVPYFTIAASQPQASPTPLRPLALFAGAVVLQIVVLAAGHAYLRVAFRDDAIVPPDERDREIERRAITSAYYVLITGMLIVGFAMPFTAKGWEIVNAALLVVVAAEAVHYAGIGVRYRRQV